ncbi:hypothetical protein LZ31DRAFT_635785 [Colletotrichum somersetense]|nr:hypothetical protein LZ31DRAFT_635785 [Colletotrichum somersetense]
MEQDPTTGLLLEEGATLDADVVILCTGYSIARHTYLAPGGLESKETPAPEVDLDERIFPPRSRNLSIMGQAEVAGTAQPIIEAQAWLITDPDDDSLLNSNNGFIDNQCLLGHNILARPILNPGVYNRDVYLPGTDLWFPSNLRVQDGSDPLKIKHAAWLEKPVAGGTTISFGCGIPDGINTDQIPFVTLVYLCGGAIVPQLEVRQSMDQGDYNPPTIHIYPGNKKTVRSTPCFLDDGVSRDSAPDYLPQYTNRHDNHKIGTHEAQNKYREVKFVQGRDYAPNRLIQISHPWNGFNADRHVGTSYQLAIWAVKATAPKSSGLVSVTFKDQTGRDIHDSGLQANYDVNRAVLIVDIPVGLVPSLPRNSAGAAPSADAYILVNVSNLN